MRKRGETRSDWLGDVNGWRSHLWTIVLAGGEGERTKAFVRARFGVEKPKQYCTFVGDRSLLQHTVDRADRLSSAKRRVIVAARHHRYDVEEQLVGRPGGTVLYQPRNLGTAPGLFLPLARILASDPEALVAVFPSDHFIYPEGRFHEAMSRAFDLSRRLKGRPVLLGVEPERPEPEYGWIEAGECIGPNGDVEARSVESFVEKPSREIAEDIARRGGLWNTSIVVARAAALWVLGWRYCPSIMPWFTAIREVFEESRPGITPELDLVYSKMSVKDFSRDVLEPAARELSVMKLDSCSWSDWGSPERILQTLSRLGKRRTERRARPLVSTDLPMPLPAGAPSSSRRPAYSVSKG